MSRHRRRQKQMAFHSHWSALLPVPGLFLWYTVCCVLPGTALLLHTRSLRRSHLLWYQPEQDQVCLPVQCGMLHGWYLPVLWCLLQYSYALWSASLHLWCRSPGNCLFQAAERLRSLWWQPLEWNPYMPLQYRLPSWLLRDRKLPCIRRLFRLLLHIRLPHEQHPAHVT